MRVCVEDQDGGLRVLWLEGRRVGSFTEHDLRDIEFALAARRAMSKRCDAETGEHTCALAPAHRDSAVALHQCRACMHNWPGTPPVAQTGRQS
jgi:hypothetical protein